MHIFTSRQVKCFLSSVVVLLLSALPGAKAQVVGHGREAVRGTVNFTDAANYLLAHPYTEPRHEAENEEEFEDIPHIHPAITDTTLLRRRVTGTGTSGSHSSFIPMTALPVSYTATDTFESTLDPGFAIPPDTHGGVDSNYAVTTINTTVKVQTRAGGAVSSVTLNSFWTSVLPGGGAFDPRIHYDPYTDRWIFVAVSGGNDPSSSILLGVSQTSNPTGSWYLYKILAESTGTYWLDYPDVGFNGKWITVTGNLFEIGGSSYGGAKVFVFDKATVMSGSGAPYTSFLETGSATICPALTYSSTLQNMFMVETYWGGFAGGGQMHVWKISGNVGFEAMTSVGFPVSPNRWQDQATGGLDFAPQSGTANKLQTNDDRVNQLVFMNNRLWFAHTVFFPYSTTLDPTRSSIQWWQTDTLGTPIQVGLIDDNTNTNFYAFPSLIVNTNNDAFIGFSKTSATTFPSAAYALRLSTDPVDSMRPEVVYRHGQAKYYKTFSGSRNRFGDYSAAALDPLNMTDFWTIQEASAAPSGGVDRWDTWWAYVKLCNPPAPITGATTVCPGNTTTLSDATSGGNWTSSNTSIATVGSSSGTVTGVAAGGVTITYSVGSSCYATYNMTVLTGPTSISGTTSMCVGSSSTLSGTPSGGTWTSSDISIATIGSTSGTVNGISNGTAVISYATSGSCILTTTVTINALPASITGTTTVCTGSTTALSSSTSGGTWTSGSTGVATVGSTSGIVFGVSGGTAPITYTASGCSRTTTVTVNPSPAAISGATSLCEGATTTLSDASGAGTWSSSNTTVATIGSVSGTVTGLSAGTTNIIFTLNSNGCTATRTETVNPTPAAITGTMLFCPGAAVPLSNTVSGGTWSSGNTAVATVGSSSGIVTGVASGTANITYAIGTCRAIATVTVDVAPAAITGTLTVCEGSTTTLSDASSGGTWTSGNLSVATIGSTSGTVTGIAAGTSIITYSTGTICNALATVTVNTTPAPITGTMLICPGATTTLSNSVAGGVWTSGNTAIATVGTGTGTVTGVSSGTVNITYTLGACRAIATVTVDVAPAPITGTLSVCVGNNTTLSDASGGGTWTSGNTSVATIGSTSGTVTGVAAGTAVITYSTGTACNALATVTVNTSPGAITGTPNVCPGATTALGNSVGGGTWTSGNTAIATVNSSGVVTGVSTGTSNITYSLGAGCESILTVTVDVGPSAITGTTTVCTGATTTLGNATGGGTWASSNTGVATIGSTSGTVTGVAAGTSVITYSTGVSCIATTTVTVITAPGAITGTTTLCAGNTSALGNSVGGGTWSSSNTAVATVSSTGVVTGVSAGTATITYTTGGTCTATVLVTVNTPPAAIVGSTTICISSTATLTDATGGGIWSSSDPTVASIGSTTGIVTGVAAGSAVITYAVGSCYVTMGMTVSSSPGAITGAVTICNGTTSTLSNPTLGGTWTSSNVAVVTIGSSSGVATAVSPGSAMITYSLGGSCFATTMFNVNPLPAPITAGTTTICAGTTTTLSDATAGGTWSSSNTAVATVGSTSAIVTGIASGTATITYRLATGCVATTLITVNPIPAPITGASSVCVGGNTTLSDATGSGVWSSSDPLVASIVSGTGAVTGVTVGFVTITYQLGTGCKVTTPFTVNPLPATITGTTSVCVGATTTLADATTGGTWTSGSAGVATVGASSGIVTGVSVGTAAITYTLGTGCLATTNVTVSTVAVAAISGPSAVCVGQTITLTDPVSGGVWSSSSSAATVGASSGIVTGMSAGTAVISYSVTNPCGTAVATYAVTVNALPSVAPISGLLSICTGGTVLYTDATGSGVWSSGNPAVATVSSTGSVTGISPGTAPISYTVTSGAGCSSYAIVTTTVANPPSITVTTSGPTSFCRGGSVLLSATAISGYTYQWKLGGIDIPGATTTSYLDSVSGSITVVVSGSGGCTTTSTPVVVTVSSSFAVTPSVSITAVPGTILCLTSSTVSFTANPVNGGSAPTYQWYVNGTSSGTGAVFSYTPADGDVVKVKMISNDPCAFPDSATTSVTMTVTLPRTPSVSILPSPNDSVCVGTHTTFTAMPVNGGTAPSYVWTKNGTTVPGVTGSTYGYVPANGDVLVVTLNSTYPCVSSTTATSTAVVMHVDPIVTNTLTITVTHSTIGAGQADTFTAVAPNGGAAPVFQWYIDASPVIGATGPVFITTALTDGQTVSAAVTSSEPCADPATALSNGIRIAVSTGVTTQVKSEGSFTLVPNPNKGTFTIKGAVKGYTDEKVTITVTDVLGQEVHTQTARLHNGMLDEHITLGSTLANGMYLVRITTGDEHAVLHMVINK